MDDVGEVLTLELDETYWPSYEIVSDVFHFPYKADRRHPQPEVIDYNMKLFERTWCSDSDLTEMDMAEAWIAANAASGRLPAEVLDLIPGRKAEVRDDHQPS